jgi:hypothetical protein
MQVGAVFRTSIFSYSDYLDPTRFSDQSSFCSSEIWPRVFKYFPVIVSSILRHRCFILAHHASEFPQVLELLCQFLFLHVLRDLIQRNCQVYSCIFIHVAVIFNHPSVTVDPQATPSHPYAILAIVILPPVIFLVICATP